MAKPQFRENDKPLLKFFLELMHTMCENDIEKTKAVFTEAIDFPDDIMALEPIK